MTHFTGSIYSRCDWKRNYAKNTEEKSSLYIHRKCIWNRKINEKWSVLTFFARHDQWHLPTIIMMNLLRGNWLRLLEDVRADHFSFIFFIPCAFPTSVQRTFLFCVFSTVSFPIAPTMHSHDAHKRRYLPIEEWTRRLLNPHISFTFRSALDAPRRANWQRRSHSTNVWRSDAWSVTCAHDYPLVRCVIAFHALFVLDCPFLHKSIEIYLLLRTESPQVEWLIALLIAHPEKAPHGPNWCGTTFFVAPLFIPTLIGKHWPFLELLIFQLNCPFKTIVTCVCREHCYAHTM